MKFSRSIAILANILLSSTILNLSPSASASDNKYYCREVNGAYGIYARTERGYLGLLDVERNVSEDWTVSKRCYEVAQRFQGFYKKGNLRFIGADFVNNEPVLCALKDKITEGEPCNSENVLVTLPPQSDPVETARRLMNTRDLAKGRSIAVNGGTEGKLETYVNGNTYYDLAVLEQLILQQENSDRLIQNE
jgi:hypothetical protein